MLDPVPYNVVRAALALLLLISVWQKLRSPGAFARALAGYRLLPDALVVPAAVTLVLAELALAAGLVLGLRVALAGVAALLALYTLAIAINLARGRADIDCGCAGPYQRRPLSRWLLLRNSLLVLVATIGMLPAAPRALLWVDAISIVAGVLLLAVLYAAFEVLAATAPRLEELQRG